MNVNLNSLKEALRNAIDTHLKLKGTSGNGEDFEKGFISCLRYVIDNIIPAFETEEITEAEQIEDSMAFENEMLESKHRFGL